ncbi:MAG: Re/Si-specific NAD(P)(+) transhydrogenase subunit alpha [Arenicellales bacterium]
MRIGVPREIYPGEKRVATTPAVVADLLALGYEVAVEQGAGQGASFRDEDYRKAGATVETDVRKLWNESDIILKINAPGHHPDLDLDESELLSPGKLLISLIWPAQNETLMKRLAARGATVCAMDSVPRISRAQKLDVLSSMSNVAGYRAVIEAANAFGRFFTGQVTAAGKVPPAKVLVIGAGVAGLSAVGAAGSLGAVVRAFDTRPEVKEQVESMGAEFLQVEIEEEGSGAGGYAKEMSEEFIKAEMALFQEQAEEVDVIVTTALIPGKPAPKLITATMVQSMKPGSVIVDLAAEQGGNCELTEPGKAVVKDGVTIIGYTDLASRLATQSSQLYATNLRHLLTELTPEKDGRPVVDMEDEVIRGLTVIKDGEITWPPPAPKISAAPPSKPKRAPKTERPAEETAGSRVRSAIWTVLLLAAGAAAILGVGSVAPPEFMNHFTVFILAIFVGYQVVWAVTPALHTPLMSVTNAISGIIVLGALLQIGSGASLVAILAGVAVLIAAVNVVGGFLVTQRMLRMFRK